MGGVLVVGALHLDVVVDAPRLPMLDETLVGSAASYRLGGKGGNQAVAAARMGAASAMAGRVGRDAFGAQLLAELDVAGVDRSQVVEVEGASGMSVAIVDTQGDYGAVIVSGVNAGLEGEGIEVLETTTVLLLQNEVPDAVNLAVARKAHERTTVILNAAPARAIHPHLQDRIDVLVVNRVEAAMLTGQSAESLDPVRAAETLWRTGPKSVIVTLGGEGLVLVDRYGARVMPAAKVEAISTHGAGDAFIGALASALANAREDMERCVVFAQAAAALTVATPPDARTRIDATAVKAFRDQWQSAAEA